MLFPQFVCIHYMKTSNTYGSVAGYIVGLVLRLIGGEPFLSFPAAVKYPWYDESTQTQLFPYKTLAMLSSLFIFITVSSITHVLFTSGVLPRRYDIFKCFKQEKQEEIDMKEIDDKTKGIVLNKSGVNYI